MSSHKIKISYCNCSRNCSSISQSGSHKQNKTTTHPILCPQIVYLQDVVSFFCGKGTEQVISAWCLIPFSHSEVIHCCKCTGMLCWECGDDHIMILPAHTLPLFPLGNNSRAKGFRATLVLI